MRQAYAHLLARGLADSHFEAVGNHLQAALQELGVPDAPTQEVMAIFGSARNDVLNR